MLNQSPSCCERASNLAFFPDWCNLYTSCACTTHDSILPRPENIFRFSTGGFVDVAFTIQLFNAVLPHLAFIFRTDDIINLHFLSHMACTQTYVDNTTQPPPFRMVQISFLLIFMCVWRTHDWPVQVHRLLTAICPLSQERWKLLLLTCAAHAGTKAGPGNHNSWLVYFVCTHSAPVAIPWATGDGVSVRHGVFQPS